MDEIPNTSLVIRKQDKIEALVEWFSLPPELRPEPTLRQLALRLGIPPDGGFYQLAKSSRVLRDVVAATAIGILPRIPEVLDTLAENGIRGNTKAADVLLNHVRQVLDLLPNEKDPTRSLTQSLADTERAVDKLLQFAQDYPSPVLQEAPTTGLGRRVCEAGMVDPVDDQGGGPRTDS